MQLSQTGWETDMAGEYPEHEKLSKIKNESQAIGEFVEWLEGKGIELCAIPPEFDHTYLPIHRSINDLLAEHFSIDLDKIEQEKRQMLEAIRASH